MIVMPINNCYHLYHNFNKNPKIQGQQTTDYVLYNTGSIKNGYLCTTTKYFLSRSGMTTKLCTVTVVSRENTDRSDHTSESIAKNIATMYKVPYTHVRRL